MLATMKLGAVVIPASTMLTEADLADRVARGRGSPGDRGSRTRPALRRAPGRISPGRRRWRAGLARLCRERVGVRDLRPGRRDARDRSVAAVFHLRHDIEAEARPAQPPELPGGGISARCIGSACDPATSHLNISSPGWAKHAWSSFFGPWNAEATILVLNQKRFDARSPPAPVGLVRRDHVLRAPPTGVAHVGAGRSERAATVHVREAVSAGEPLNPEVIERVSCRLGRHDPRWLRPDRDDPLQIGNAPGEPVVPGSMWAGRCRVTRSGCSIPMARTPREGEIAIALDPAPTGLMQGYVVESGAFAGAE